MLDVTSSLAYRAIVDLHIAAGTVALGAYWCAGLARKRRGLHVQSGRVYLWAMRAILATAVPMALAAFLRERFVQGTFLLYLVVLVATTVSSAPRAVRHKADFEAYRSGSYRFFAYALPASALAAFAVGVQAGSTLLWGFSFVGISLGIGMQRRLRCAQPAAGWWLKEHYNAMIGNGVGTHIAFLGIGLSRLLPKDWAGTVQMLAWFGPLAVALLVGAVLDRRHRQRFGTRPAALAAA